MTWNEKDMIEDVQAIIGDQIKKYREQKIRRDLGEDTKKGPGLNLEAGKAARKARVPQALLRQYLELN